MPLSSKYVVTRIDETSSIPHRSQADFGVPKSLSILSFIASFNILASGNPVLDPRASKPLGYIEEFSLRLCEDVKAPGVDDQLMANEFLPINTCIRTIVNYRSFEAGISINCTDDHTPRVIAYYSADCSGTGVDAGSLRKDGKPTSCVDVPVAEQQQGLYAQSAEFVCVGGTWKIKFFQIWRMVNKFLIWTHNNQNLMSIHVNKTFSKREYRHIHL